MFHIEEEEASVADLTKPVVVPVKKVIIIYFDGIPKEKSRFSEESLVPGFNLPI